MSETKPGIHASAGEGYRLPTNVKPTHYNLTVRTNLENLTFDGFVKIDLDIQTPTDTFVLNTTELEIGDVSIRSDGVDAEQVAVSRSFDTTQERGTFVFPSKFPAASKAQLKLAFEGTLKPSMMGYYVSKGKSEGTSKRYTLTQFEPTAARRAFPCWDEPLLKATFAVTMISDADTVNLSNMPAVSEVVHETSSQDGSEAAAWLSQKMSQSSASDDGPKKWKITYFQTTPPMSTYIVAWANGQFGHLESSYTSPLSGTTRPLRIYAMPELLPQAQFALDVKRKVLPLYEQVFDIEFPLPKLDTLVAEDFDSGAMENWGLITGRTVAFLVDPEKAKISAKKQVAETQSHEVAHMWFGNITTMAWWDNLYLNEGFATLMGEVIILDMIFPEWKVHSSFITSQLARAWSLDAKLSSHPVEVECPDANMINQIFDALSYSKAASILRMLSSYVGEEKFLKGVSIYLKKHLYANSVTRDLWDGIADAAGIDVPSMMDNWVKKIGYPVLTVTETKDGIRVRQDRFLETGPADPKDNETIWTIPLNIVSMSKNGDATIDRQIVLKEREATFPVDTSKPFKLNAGTVGFYRVLYSPERLEAIGQEAVKQKSIFTLEDRIGIVLDALALSRAGFSKVSCALQLIQTLRNEQEYVVWQSIATNVAEIISTWWEHPEIVDKFHEFRRELFSPLAKRLGFEYSDSESVDTHELRTLAISQAARAGDQEVVKELQSRFQHYMKTGDDSRILPDLEFATYRMALKYGGRAEWEALVKIIEHPKNPASATSAMRALGSTQDMEIARETFNYILTKVRDQDLFYYFMGLQMNFKTRRFVASAFKEHYHTLDKRLAGNFGMSYLVRFSFQSLSSYKDLQETEEFFKDKDTSKYDMTLKQTLDTIRARAAWVERSTDDILGWIENRQSNPKL
ncbi:hypothetical protein CERSUDRAFT_86618 [Gelatoporia subvermispora B]|uniref:Aminopeptidase n=1 Tax=Ceriporiopsis subvermispora (strain B) TaxID=914234 RepID=M2R776_CERS8|nr:hypothetical protein CERSUDRAFT_86618 [Gelatoporia subvermispora B]